MKGLVTILVLRLLTLVVIIILFSSLGYCQDATAGQKVNWFGRIVEAQTGLKKLKLKRAGKIATYDEIRKVIKFSGEKGQAGLPAQAGIVKTVIIKQRDYAWKEIGLALLNTKTGELKLAKVRKEGAKLVNPNKGFSIELEERVNGLTWNGRNTAFKITPSDWVVIGSKYIGIINKRPKEIIYVPYSTGLYQREIVEMGDLHLLSDNEKAIASLNSLKVQSLWLPDMNITDVVSPDYAYNIALVEHIDPDEFHAFVAGALEFSPFERVLVLLAINSEEAFQTFNYAGAIGLTQFTNNGSKKHKRLGTWDTVRNAYPKAKLPSFNKGSTNHRESIKATMLLYDLNLGALLRVFGPEILKDKNLDHYLYAAHNCGIGRVINAIKTSRERWRKVLRELSPTDQTNVFLQKIDYLLSRK